MSKSSRESCNKLETAWNRYDSVSFPAFAEDANFIHISWGTVRRAAGYHRSGAPPLRDDLQGQHASFVLWTIRFLRPDVAVVFARAHVKFKEGNEARDIDPPNVDRG